MNYWIIAINEDNWHVIKETNKYGAPEGSRATQLIKPGDVIIFYVKEKGAKELGGMFVGAYEAASQWYSEHEPLWPDEKAKSKPLYPSRINLKPIKLGKASFRQLAENLSFISNKQVPHAYLVGTPANMRRPISEEDAKLIINTLS